MRKLDAPYLFRDFNERRAAVVAGSTAARDVVEMTARSRIQQ
jgi:hypothetical protein